LTSEVVAGATPVVFDKLEEGGVLAVFEIGSL
jgi:hypothetical protein